MQKPTLFLLIILACVRSAATNSYSGTSAANFVGGGGNGDSNSA